MQKYLIPSEEIESEIEIKKSRFIVSMAPVFSVDEAKRFILRIKKKHPNASHHVSTYIIGHGNTEIAHCTDDGEPSGTAGRPALAVLRGSGLGDVVAVVTRYFGGTKLGTGGLVRAYSGAVKQGLSNLPRGMKVPTYQVMMVLNYPFYERARRIIDHIKGIILDESFTSDITLTVQIKVEDLDTLQSALSELTSGTVQVEVVSTNPGTIMPIETEV
jgi:uncharacterized YigZ family protein